MRKIEQEVRNPLKSEIEPADPLAQYLQEVAKIPILTISEERKSLGQIRKGREANEALIRRDGHLSDGERKEFQSQKDEGDLAKDKLIRANLRLVISIAKRRRGQGVSFPDLIQEGNIGLMTAVDKYDIKKVNPQTGEPYRFTTYAFHWIRQAMSRAVAYQGRTFGFRFILVRI